MINKQVNYFYEYLYRDIHLIILFYYISSFNMHLVISYY